MKRVITIVLAVVLIGGFAAFSYHQKQHDDALTKDGVTVSAHPVRVDDFRSHSRRGASYTYYRVVYEYVVDGEHFKVNGPDRSSYTKAERDFHRKKFTVKYNKDNPADAIVVY